MKNENVDYNGWSNYETWLAYCWITHENTIFDRIIESLRNMPDDRKEVLKRSLKGISGFVTDCSRHHDSLGLAGSLAVINYDEILESVSDDLADLAEQETRTWWGVDSSNETSLFEYGFLMTKADDYEDEYFLVYLVGDVSNLCGKSYIRESELNDLVKGDDWMNPEDVKEFLSYVGNDLEQFISSPVESKLHSLIAYWGIENILGTDYWPVPVTQFTFYDEMGL